MDRLQQNGTLSAVRWERPILQVLDQLLLPHEQVWITIKGSQAAHDAIKAMQVRGAPLIAIVAALGLASDLLGQATTLTQNSDLEGAFEFLEANIKLLKKSRPTAVNLFEAMDLLDSVIAAKRKTITTSAPLTVIGFIEEFVQVCEGLLTRDVHDNLAIGDNGCQFLEARHLHSCKDNETELSFSVLTHCNTGSLATAGYGTALGIIRSLYRNSTSENRNGGLAHVYCTETRPYNQGARLTAFELHSDKIPYTLITDSMVSYLIHQQQLSNAPVKAIIVGADRVCKNGDTANKIGTLQLSIIAKHFGIDFIIAAPTTTIDLSLPTGASIPIEYRPPSEMLTVSGILESGARAQVAIAPPSFNVWNPSFDVTPASNITAIVTEKGVYSSKSPTGEFDLSAPPSPSI